MDLRSRLRHSEILRKKNAYNARVYPWLILILLIGRQYMGILRNQYFDGGASALSSEYQIVDMGKYILISSIRKCRKFIFIGRICRADVPKTSQEAAKTRPRHPTTPQDAAKRRPRRYRNLKIKPKPSQVDSVTFQKSL